jgi:glyoxylase-like metal-dependent hydrolase (beta-lactamase superfamily II)
MVTHHHEDHGGNAGRIAAAYGCPVYAPPDSLSLLRTGFAEEYYRRIIWGQAPRFVAQPCPDEPIRVRANEPPDGGDTVKVAHAAGGHRTPTNTGHEGTRSGHHGGHSGHSGASGVGAAALGVAALASLPHPHTAAGAAHRASAAPVVVTATDGDATVTLVRVPAPGHCPDHSVYHVPERGWLFTADLLVTPKPRVARYDEDVLQGLASLRHVCDRLHVGTVFCAHKGPTADGGAALRARLDWLEGLRARAGERYLQRGEPIREVSRALLGREDFLQYFSHGDFSRLNLTAGLLADVVRPEDAHLVPTPSATGPRNEAYWRVLGAREGVSSAHHGGGHGAGHHGHGQGHGRGHGNEHPGAGRTRAPGI